MDRFSIRKKILVISLAVIAIAVIAALVYRHQKIALLDRSAFDEFSRSVSQASDSGEFVDQEALRSFITSWAEDNDLKYRVDSGGNIIFNKSADKRKKNVSPTVVCVSINYKTVSSNAELLASAAMIARADIPSGRRTVIFFNDEDNTGYGYRHCSSKYFSNKTKVIYLDYGKSSYMSCSSYARRITDIVIPAVKKKAKCDTAIRIRIKGITTSEIGSGTSKRPDPLTALSTLLTRLKSKSTTYQVAGVRLGSNGCMYPDSVKSTILINSYSVPSFTKYIDKQIRKWEKDYKKDYPDLEYTYKIIDDPDKMPAKAYTQAVSGRLTNVLYAAKNGLYKYEDNDSIPDGFKEGEAYGINAFTDINAEKDEIRLEVLTQGYDDESLDRISSDNTAVADLFGCETETVSQYSPFRNDRDKLSRTLMKTYVKVNDITSAHLVLQMKEDRNFTPCSYIADINSKCDIVHLRLNENKAKTITNTVLCYIETKGNFLSL